MFDSQWDETPFDELTEEQLKAAPINNWVGDPAQPDLRVPSEFAEMTPGPELAAFLSVIDVSAIPGHDRVIVLRALQRMLSHYQAAVYEAMSSIVEVFDPEIDYVEAARSAATEIRAALRLTRRTADSELGIAESLRTGCLRYTKHSNGATSTTGVLEPCCGRPITSRRNRLGMSCHWFWRTPRS